MRNFLRLTLLSSILLSTTVFANTRAEVICASEKKYPVSELLNDNSIDARVMGSVVHSAEAELNKRLAELEDVDSVSMPDIILPPGAYSKMKICVTVIYL